MKNSVSLYEAKTQLSTLLREVESGAVITITRHGKPVAELRGIAAERPRPRAGSLKSPNFYMAEDFDAPLPEFAEYANCRRRGGSACRRECPGQVGDAQTLMNLLLDTSALLLFLEGSKRLPVSIKETIQSADHQCFVSIVSGWEIAIKSAIGKLSIGYSVEPDLRVALMSNGIEVLPVTWEDVGQVERLPLHHGDPFDRLLIVQAMRLGLHSITPDEAWDRYGVSRLWA